MLEVFRAAVIVCFKFSCVFLEEVLEIEFENRVDSKPAVVIQDSNSSIHLKRLK